MSIKTSEFAVSRFGAKASNKLLNESAILSDARSPEGFCRALGRDVLPSPTTEGNWIIVQLNRCVHLPCTQPEAEQNSRTSYTALYCSGNLSPIRIF